MTSLAAIPALRALPPASLAAVGRASRTVRYGAGSFIRAPGTPADGVLLLLAGTVAAEHATVDGTPVWPDRWTGPSIVDKPAALDGGAWPSGLVAVTACTGRLLPRNRFLRLLEEESSVRRHVLAHLARDVLVGRRQLAQAVTLPAAARVAAWLANQADPVAWRGTQEQLGRVLGLSRVTVNRALSRLARAGAITLSPHGIVVIDRRRLG